MKSAVPWMLIACLLLFPNGCAHLLGLDGLQPTYKDISNDPTSWNAFSKNKVYTLIKPIYLLTDLDKEHGGDEAAPSDRSDWDPPSDDIPQNIPAKSDDLKKYPKIKCVLDTGTHFQAIKIIFVKWVETSTTFYVLKVLDGPYAGTTCYIDAMEKLAEIKNPDYIYGQTPVYLPGPNPKYFTTLSPSTTQPTTTPSASANKNIARSSRFSVLPPPYLHTPLLSI